MQASAVFDILFNFGFLLSALQSLVNILPTWLLHFCAIGGIGLITLAMMSHVSLAILVKYSLANYAHASCFYAAGLELGISFFLPLLAAEYYVWWVNVSGAFWIAAFTINSTCFQNAP